MPHRGHNPRDQGRDTPRDEFGRGLSVASVDSSTSATSGVSAHSGNSGTSSAASSVQFAPPLSDSAEARNVDDRGRGGRSRSGSLTNSLGSVFTRDEETKPARERGRSRSRSRVPNPSAPLIHILHSFRPPFIRDSSNKEHKSSREVSRDGRESSRDLHRESFERGRWGFSHRSSGSRSPSAHSQRQPSSSSLGLPSISLGKGLSNIVQIGNSSGSSSSSHNNDADYAARLPESPASTLLRAGRSRSLSRSTDRRRSASLERTESIRHANLPGGLSRKERPSFVRVYRPDGTFGTIACPPDIRADRLLQLAVRKFFIGDSAECRLLAVFPEAVSVLEPSSKPVQLVKDLLVSAGYHSVQDKLTDVCRDDTSFVCRIVLASINLPLRPPLLTQAPGELIVTNTDIVDAPALVCSDANSVELLDVSGSAFQQTSLRLPKLETLKLERLFVFHPTVPNSFLMPLTLSAAATNLQSISLAHNGLVNVANIDFTCFPQLRSVDLRGNQLTELPSSLLHLPFLEVLDCGTNALVHYDTWNPSLKSLRLSYNRFERIVLTQDQALQMVNLRELELCANVLTGLPDALHVLPALKSLDVRHNLIANPLDALVPTLHRLVASYNNPRVLTQQHNVATEVPPSPSALSSNSEGLPVCILPHLRELKLEGLPMLRIVGRLVLQSITTLDMRNTHLPVVDEALFVNAPNLRVLNLSSNSLCRIPASIGQLRLLEDLDVSCNALVDLPSELFALPALRRLDLHANNLKALPSNIWLMPGLRTLNISSNLIDSLPPHPASHPHDSLPNRHAPLVAVFACDNQLSEDVFEALASISTLRILNLSYNFIAEIPNGVFAQLPHLEELYLSGNRLNTLPHEDFDHAGNLRILQANSNKLHTLPAELAKASRLEILDVSANGLRYNVANWPYDWNWRWNEELRYLNFSYNKRLEIRRSAYPSVEASDSEEAPPYVDLADFCVLPKLMNLGLMDVTLTTGSVPFQTETCRVRTYGSDLNSVRLGIADTLGFRPLAINDLVVERFRNRPDESLIAMFDGFNESPWGGNKISHLAQETFAALFKAELEAEVSVVDALRRAFLATHREIGNNALLSPEEMAHTFLGHRCPAAQRLCPDDWQAGTGATVLYIRDSQLWVATVGGGRVVFSRGNGTHKVASKPLPPVSGELDRIRAAGGVVDSRNSYVNNASPFPRMIGGYSEGTAFSAAPSIYEYDLLDGLDPADQIIIGSAAIWDTLQHETAADIVRSAAGDPMLAALKLRDFAMAYGMTDRAMVMVVGKPLAEVSKHHSQGELGGHDGELGVYRKRRHSLPADSTLARLGFEVSPPFGEVTMVFTDIRSSTYLWENYPAVMRAAIKTHNSLMRRSIRLMEGYEVKNEGDAFMICFHTPIKALIWCLTVQQHLLTAEWPPELLNVAECAPVYDENGSLIFRGLSVRIGIHCGRAVAEPDPVTRRMDYFGPMVNRASRISGIADGGQISVSSDFLSTLQRDLDAHKEVLRGMKPEQAYPWVSPEAADALERSVAVLDHTEYTVDEVGELKLRGIENPEHIYKVYPKSLYGRRKWYAERERESHKEQSLKIARAEQAQQMAIVQRLSSQAQSQPSSHSASLSQLQSASQAGSQAAQSTGSSIDLKVQSLPMASSESLDTPGSPLSPLTNRPSLASIIDSDVEEYRAAMPKEHHSLHLNPHLNPQMNSFLGRRSSSQTSASLFNERALGRMESFEDHTAPASSTLEDAPPVPQEPLNTAPQQFKNVEGMTDPLQAVCHRLEALCASLTTSVPIEKHRGLLKQLEPGVPTESETAAAAQQIWLTRVENALARLREIYGPEW